MHILDALANFQTQLEANGRSIHTRQQYRRHITQLAAWLAENGHSGMIEDITHETIADFLACPGTRQRPDGRPKKPSAMNALRSSLRTFFRWLHAAGYLPLDPARLVQRARCAPPPPRALSNAEQKMLLDAFGSAATPEERRDVALFSTMLNSGIRSGSAIQLNIEDIDFDRHEIRLRRAKGNREEVVYLNPTARRALREAVGDRAEGAVFVSRQGKRVSQRHIARRFRWWLGRARITKPYSPHSLRHCFGTRIYERTRDLLLTQAAMNHKSIFSTVVYVGISERRLRRALEA
jgi:site-specific recombinase XerD